MTPATDSPRRGRVLVTDVEERSALAACRGLARAGYVVTGVAGARPAPGHWSRSCSRRVRLADPRADPKSFVAGLEAELRTRDYSVLLPGADVSAFLVSDHRERLAPLARVALPDRRAVRASLDKVRLLEAADEAGLPAPPVDVCEDDAEAYAAVQRLGLPVVVKPAASFLPDGAGFRQQPAVVVDRLDALPAALESAGRPFLVQRFEGGARIVSCAGVAVPGGLLGLVVTRWRRRWPSRAGSAAFCESIPPPPGVVERVEVLLSTLGVEGIFELELLERGDGRHAAIDLNARPFGWLSLALAAGVNLPSIYCDWVCGGSPSPASARRGVRYRWEDGDLRHLVADLRLRRWRDAFDVLRPARRTVHPHFSLQDPGPLAARALLLAGNFRRRRRSVQRSPGEPQRRWRPAADGAGEGRGTEPGPGYEAHHGPEVVRRGRADEVETGHGALEAGV